MNILIADIETNGLLSKTDSLPPMDRIWCISIASQTGKPQLYSDLDPDALPLSEGLSRLSSADRLVFHNGLGFDVPAINKLYPGTVRFDQVYDTLVVSRMLFPENKRHSLRDWGEYCGLLKGDYDGGWEQYTPAMGSYCNQDVVVTQWVYQHLQQRMMDDLKQDGIDWRRARDVEHQVAWVIALQERHGFRLDVQGAASLEAELRQEMHDIERGLQEDWRPQYVPDKGAWCLKTRTWVNVAYKETKRKRSQVIGEHRHHWEPDTYWIPVTLQAFNPGSRQQIAQRLSKQYGWVPTKYTDAGSAQIDDAVLGELTRYPEAQKLARYFRLSKQLGQVSEGDNGWLKLVTPEGYVHGRVNPCGARTYRMAHFKPNMAQVDKKDLRMRAVWIADPGHVLVDCDAEGLELRMLAHYLAAWDKGRYAKTVVEGSKEDESDVHNVNKRAAGLNTRDYAKTMIYATLYGGGNHKLGAIAIEDAKEAGKPRPKGQQATIGKRLRKNLEEGIRGFDKLVSGTKLRHKQRGWLKGLDGRKVMSASEHSALNTLLQSAGAIVMKYAQVVWHFEVAVEMGIVDPSTYEPTCFAYTATVHDEICCTVEPEWAEQVGAGIAKAIQLAGERLNIQCPLSGSYEIGSNWAEIH